MVRLVLIGDNDVDLLAHASALGSAGFSVDILIQHTSHLVPFELHGDATSPNEHGRSRVERAPNYAAARWARAVAKLVKEQGDVRTIAEWARSVGVSAGALRNWCRAASVSPRKSLILSRLLRCVRQADGVPWRAEQFLDVTDPRTLAKILKAGGLDTTNGRVTVDELLNRQKLISDDSAIAVLRALLQGPPSKSTAVNVEDCVCSEA